MIFIIYNGVTPHSLHIPHPFFFKINQGIWGWYHMREYVPILLQWLGEQNQHWSWSLNYLESRSSWLSLWLLNYHISGFKWYCPSLKIETGIFLAWQLPSHSLKNIFKLPKAKVNVKSSEQVLSWVGHCF